MNERLPNPIVDVERELSCAIASIGGVRVDQLVGKVQEKNADFLFDQYSVIAELKILTKDQINSPEFVKKSSAIYKKYLSAGLAPVRVHGTARLTTEGFPEEFTREIADLYSAPIGRVIRSADRQIRSTREMLNRNEYAGVLLLVNNGNTALTPSNLRWSLGQHLQGGAYPGINEVIFFTVNMPLSGDMSSLSALGVPKDMDLHIWFRSRRKGIASADERFEPALRGAWFQHQANLLGRVAEFHGDDEMFNQLSNKPL